MRSGIVALDVRLQAADDYDAGGRVEAIRTPPDLIQLIPPDSTHSLADANGNVRH